MSGGQLLKQGDKAKMSHGSAVCTIERLLGSGTQGEVYLARAGSEELALKWYFPATASVAHRRSMEVLVANPINDSRFLWPLSIVEKEGLSGFGYVMPLRQARFHGLIDLMARRVDCTFRALCTASFHLADAFLKLHSQGLCYRDINFGNVFFDGATGEIAVCDNDNVAANNGEVNVEVLGTPRFMAPEIVRGESKPNADTDRWSLAVLFFFMFVMHHPLEGKKETEIKCLDLPAMNKLYGTDPRFIYDPQDRSNEPDGRYHQNAIEIWRVLPTALKQAFTKAFTVGIRTPGTRLRETEWKGIMIQLRDSIVYGSTGEENFLDPVALASGASPKCWASGQEIVLPMVLKFDQAYVVLNHDTRIYPHHTGKQYDFSKEVASVVQNPNDPRIWGIKNLTNLPWQTRRGGGEWKVVDPGRSAMIAPDTEINFGTRSAKIVSARELNQHA